MSCCIQFLKWSALSLHFYSKNSFSKNIHYVMHLFFKNGKNMQKRIKRRVRSKGNRIEDRQIMKVEESKEGK